MEILPDLLIYWKEILILATVWLALIVFASRYSWLKDKLVTIKTVTEILAIIIAGVWVYELFVYDEVVKPKLLPPHVSVTSEAEITGDKGDLRVVQVRSMLKNSSKTKVFVLAYWFDIYSYEIKETVNGEHRDFSSGVLSSINLDPAAHRQLHARGYARAQEPVLIQIEPLLRQDWWLEAGEEVSISRTVFISSEYDVAEISFHARIAKSLQNLCIHWAPKNVPGERSGEIGPVTYLKDDRDDECSVIEDLVRFDRNNPEHIKIRRNRGLSTTLSRTELSLIK